MLGKKTTNYLRRHRRFTDRIYIEELGASVSKATLDEFAKDAFEQISMQCLPASIATTEEGYFIIHQANTFTLECDEGMIQPLYTYKYWKCDPSFLLINGLHIPTACVEKKLPALISKELKMNFIDPVRAGCDRDGFLKVFGAEWIKFLAKNHFETFEVNGLLFRHDPVLLSDTCTVAVNNNGKFETKLKVTFRTLHKPHSFTLPDDTHHEVEVESANHIARFTKHCIRSVGLMRDFEWYDLFDLDVYSTFQVDHCADQVRTVELKENHFIAEIPACRTCDRGLYLDRKTQMCFRCPRGWYAILDDNDCLPCPLVERLKSVSGDSLVDCYYNSVCDNCIMKSIGEGLTVFVTFHLSCIIFLLWNSRHLLSRMKGKSVDESTFLDW
ncbi:hypothetical protein RRG08_030335 [Elysia crispata]|uniref:Uncharacterized protein n=1 Tax=Elysia crispata TaxID=231223 RepID=A0AAE0YIM1_9GAST|nr:hypothetical protein RRG08_030335 [Elysia crispata]